MMRFAGLASVMLVGCATLQTKADDAFRHRQYREAARLYDQMLVEQPENTSARSPRDLARAATLGVILARAETARRKHQPEAATAEVADLLDQRDAWKMATPPAIAA